VIRNDPGEFTLDGRMFRIIREIDGKKTIGAIAKATGTDAESMRQIIRALLEREVIAPADGVIERVKEEFFAYLTNQLCLAIGPMAEVLIDDALEGIGLNRDRFQMHQARDLVQILTQKIPREEKRSVFKQNLTKRIFNEEV
jgi:hypothetical protein